MGATADGHATQGFLCATESGETTIFFGDGEKIWDMIHRSDYHHQHQSADFTDYSVRSRLRVAWAISVSQIGYEIFDSNRSCNCDERRMDWHDPLPFKNGVRK